jgi:hypothetical protein
MVAEQKVPAEQVRGRWPIKQQVAVLVVVAAASLLQGYATYRSIAAIRISPEGWADLSLWSWVSAGGAVATFAAAVLAIVCLVRTEYSRLLPVISLVSALFLPPFAFYCGFRLGVDVAAASVGQDVSGLVTRAGGSAFLTWLLDVFGG